MVLAAITPHPIKSRTGLKKRPATDSCYALQSKAAHVIVFDIGAPRPHVWECSTSPGQRPKWRSAGEVRECQAASGALASSSEAPSRRSHSRGMPPHTSRGLGSAAKHRDLPAMPSTGYHSRLANKAIRLQSAWFKIPVRSLPCELSGGVASCTKAAVNSSTFSVVAHFARLGALVWFGPLGRPWTR